ncbi:UPF0280 family protein [Pseudaminobacter sp. NGMCC 1.201702]|uniref:UPF0280 family protein n=1 Tax=Pseudaminobacter sp. NGMCC 1.201702 TaxID=3391825 RepID=UPI0039EE03B5
MSGPQVAWLADARRLHLNHGPIDLIVEAFGHEAERRAAYDQAIARFQTVLPELVEELSELRRPATATPRAFRGTIAQRMERVVCRHAPVFITPMATVAGAVAEEILGAMCAGRRLEKAYVNDGGDIALYLGESQTIRAAIAGTFHGLADRIVIRAADPVRGIATSGWRGRSHSLGIADAVTVLARTAAEADAAATLIANAVDLPGHPSITRAPAASLQPDSDLGDTPVTVDVGPLTAAEIATALDRGLGVAEELRRRGLIEAAALFLGGEMRLSGRVLSEQLSSDVTPLCPAGHLPLKGGDSPSSATSPNLNDSRNAPEMKLLISPP